MMVDIASLRKYVLARRMEDGGFTFCHPLPSSLPETFYATYVLRSLDVPFDFVRTTKFLKSRIKKEIYSIYYVYKTLDLLGEKLPDFGKFLYKRLFNVLNRGSDRDIFISGGTTASYSFDSPNILKSICLVSSSINLLGLSIPRKIKVFIRSFLIQKMYNLGLREIYFCLATLDGGIKERAKLLDYVLAHECESGGFSKRPGGYPPYIEDTYYALSCLRMLGYSFPSVQTEQTLRQYLLSLQNKDGGFRRSIHGGISTLEYTYFAVAALKIMDYCLK